MTPENRHYLRPRNDLLEVEGRMSYHEGAGAWNTIRFQKRLLEEFPVLQDRSKSVYYKGLLCRTSDKLQQVIKMVTDGKVPMPLILFLYQEEP